MINTKSFREGPFIIGATGGSGTRVLARIVKHGGVHIGTNLNVSEDALDFGSYSDRWINKFTSGSRTNDQELITEMAKDLAAVLKKHLLTESGERFQKWGWKEPRSIYLLRFWHMQFPNLKFVHFVRDGRDMAFSLNQNQLKKHGRAFLSWRERWQSRPQQSILLWSRINSAAADYGEERLPTQYLRLRFEDLCAEPEEIIQRLFDFLGLKGNVREIAHHEVHPPASLGRWRKQRAAEIAVLEQLAASTLKRFDYL